MIQYYTTIEQVKKLISLGLDPGTADMYYIRNWGNIMHALIMKNILGIDYTHVGPWVH